MAVRDVKQYLLKMQAQYLEIKNDLSDFEEAFKNGYITEDKLEIIKEDTASIEVNYQRLLYIMYLLELPNRKSKKEKYLKSSDSKRLAQAFKDMNADADSVVDENKSMLDKLRADLKEITKQ